MSILWALSDIVESRHPNYQIKFQHLQFSQSHLSILLLEQVKPRAPTCLYYQNWTAR